MVSFQNRPEIRREENKVEFLEGRFLDEKLPFLHKKKAEHSFELSLSIFLSFNGVFLSLKCRTLVLKHLHGDRSAASWAIDSEPIPAGGIIVKYNEGISKVVMSET